MHVACDAGTRERLKAALDQIEQLMPGEVQTVLEDRLGETVRAAAGLYAEHGLPDGEHLMLMLRLWRHHAEGGEAFMRRCYEMVYAMQDECG